MTLKKEKIENNCFECAYFVKHYANLDGMFYVVRGCKHCICNEMDFKEKTKRLSNTVKCESWQPRKLQIEKRRQRIQDYLQIVAQKLSEIAQILEDDSNDDK